MCYTIIIAEYVFPIIPLAPDLDAHNDTYHPIEWSNLSVAPFFIRY